MRTQKFIQALNDQYFDGHLSPGFVSQLSDLPADRPDVHAFIERMFHFMRAGGHPPTDLSSLHGEILGSLLARILPGAWEGRVPPITVAGRHMVIDQYLGNNNWQEPGAKSMLDIGCGFPPHTTVEISNRYPDWKVTGADPSLPVYLVYDADGNYCTFDSDKNAVYFQPAVPSVENWNELLSDAASTRDQFTRLLESLLDENREYGDDEFPRLRIDPVHRHSTSNLSFMNGGIGQVQVEPVDVIRCFNVLFYFDDIFRQRALNWFTDQLHEDGLIVLGSNWALSTESRYYVYQKDAGRLKLREFAFSIDNFNPIGIVTWYTNHQDDRESAELAKYLRILRNNDDFSKEYYKFNDAQRLSKGICPRTVDGYYGPVDSTLSPVELWTRVAAMLDELNESHLPAMAIDVLKQSGLSVGKNEVGHISIKFD